MTDEPEIDPHNYTFNNAPMQGTLEINGVPVDLRSVSVLEIAAILAQHAHVLGMAEDTALEDIGKGQLVTRTEGGGYMVFDGAMSRAIKDAQAIASIVPRHPQPAGFDWRAHQAKLPRAGKRRRSA